MADNLTLEARSPDAGADAPAGAVGRTSDSTKRRPGRLKGCAKPAGSGRKPGQKNKITTSVKETIMARGKPIELLCDIARGVKIRVGAQAGPAKPEYVYPTLKERAHAAEILAGKIVADLKATELSGPDGKPIQTQDTTDTPEARAEEWKRMRALLLGEAPPDEAPADA